MNRITNKYGAEDQKTAEGKAAGELGETFHRNVTEFIRFHKLTPDEIISLEHHLLYSLTAACAESVLRGALNMRKEEREAAKGLTSVNS